MNEALLDSNIRNQLLRIQNTIHIESRLKCSCNAVENHNAEAAVLGC